MARPRNKEYRKAILDALDKKFASSLKDINEHLREVNQYVSYASTRRMLIKMASEGLVAELPKRRDKNEVLFTKGAVDPYVRLTTFGGDLVNLSEFITDTYSQELGLLDPDVRIKLKALMFDYLVSARPDLYKGVREVPNKDEIKKKLQYTLEYIQQLHRFIKTFLQSDIHSPVARSKVARELETVCTDKQVEILVREWWLNE